MSDFIHIGAFTTILMTASSALAEPQTLIVASHVPQTHLANARAAEPFMKCVTESAKGELAFKFFPNGQIGNPLQSLTVLNNGIAQISYISVSSLTDKMPLNNIPMLPGLGDSALEMTKTMRAVLDANGLYSEEYAKNQVVPLLINMYPPYQIMSRGPALDTLAKIHNLKIRSSGGAQTFTVKALGASAVEIAAGDSYIALQQGTIDGAIFPVASVTQYALQEQIKSISRNASFGTAAGVYAIAANVYQKLTPLQQSALQECGRKIELELAAWLDGSTEKTLADLKAKGIDVYDISAGNMPAIEAAEARARTEAIARMEQRGIPGQRGYDEYKAALTAQQTGSKSSLRR